MFNRLPPALLHSLVLVAAVFVLYRPTLDFGFVWDDHLFAEGNPAVHGWTHAGAAFTSPSATWSGDATGFTLPAWRPLRNISYIIDYTLFGLNPTGWHLTNILLHAATAVLLWLLLRRVTALAWGAPAGLACLLAALVWAVHPVLTEVAAWVKSRDDLLATPLLLGVLLAGLGASGRSLAMAALLYPLALLSKENAIVGAALLPALIILLQKKPTRGQVALMAWLAVASVIFMLLRQLALGRLAQAPHPGSPLQTVLTMLHAFTQYVRLIVWPWPPTVMSADYDAYPVISDVTNSAAMTGLALLLGITMLALVCLRRAPVISAGLFFFLVALLPFANIIPMMQVMAERFLYLPTLGLALVLVAALTRALPQPGGCPFAPLRVPVLVIVLVALPALAWQTHRRLPVWENDRALFTATAQANPASWRPASQLIRALLKEGDRSAAVPVTESALARWPNDPDILRTAALTYMFNDNETSAVELTRRAVRLQPNDYRASETLRQWREIKAREAAEQTTAPAENTESAPASSAQASSAPRPRASLGTPVTRSAPAAAPPSTQ